MVWLVRSYCVLPHKNMKTPNKNQSDPPHPHSWYVSEWFCLFTRPYPHSPTVISNDPDGLEPEPGVILDELRGVLVAVVDGEKFHLFASRIVRHRLTWSQ